MKESSAEVTPKLYETQTMIRRFGRDINSRIAVITELLSPSAKSDSDEEVLNQRRVGLTTLGNLSSHLQSAADIVSSATTFMGGTNTVEDHGSDFGDVFPEAPSDQTVHWIESNRIAEMSESSAGQLPPDAPTSADTAAEWDSDDEMDMELAQQFDRARK
jgi:hypothetical protein